MSIYKEISRRKDLKFSTSKGLLFFFQLWSLSKEELNNIAVELQEAYKESGKKSFLVKKTKKDKDIKLMFDVAYDILMTKVEETEEAANAFEIKRHNEKILNVIEKKKEEKLDNLSVEELEKLLK